MSRGPSSPSQAPGRHPANRAPWYALAALVALFVGSSLAGAGAGVANRLTYLDSTDPFYPDTHFARLATPQWIGEPGVEAVVILAIDDMQKSKPYETFLRPILERLKQIDGRAPLSIMARTVDPTDPQLQTWLKEGVSLEVHTLAHPCPLLQKGDFATAAKTVYGCLELLNQVPGNQAGAFRMPCCDSMNSPSPRFYAEIFNGRSPLGQFLTLDSSVMNLFTTNDPSLPRSLVLDTQGRERFRRYFPVETNAVTLKSLAAFATYIENYPYPYVVGKLGWEFPAMVPSDWEAFNVQGPTNAVLLADWEAALDATVLKQGVFSFIFHPHGWSTPQQLVAFIDYAVARYGRKVKFLNFLEAQQRLNQNLLQGQSLRAADGRDNGVRLLDLNNDGFMDVLIGNESLRLTRIWDPAHGAWTDSSFPVALVDAAHQETGVRFGIVQPNGFASALIRSETAAGAWHFTGQQWVEDKTFLRGLSLQGQPVFTWAQGRDRGVRFRDVNADGRCELMVGNETQNALFEWLPETKSWSKLDYALPHGAALVDRQGRDAGLRFVDLNGDGFDDLVYSNPTGYGVYTFVPVEKRSVDWRVGWSQIMREGRRGDPGEIPLIVRGGEHPNNGAWFGHGALWVQNEDTAREPFVVQRKSYSELLAIPHAPPNSPAQALASLRVKPGFQAELVACEPLVQSPIYVDWDARGRLWVVEMGDYPLGADNHGQPGGRIKILEDTDGDGRFDKATLFLDGLGFPNSLAFWRKGVVIAAAPNILFAQPRPGQSHAGPPEVLFTGFTRGNPQHLENGFSYGLDGWFYGANGDSGGRVASLKLGREVDLSGHDFRLRPDAGEFELVPGRTQYGRWRDDWGNWFGNNNSVWAWHYFLPERYLAHNPNLAVRTLRQATANYPNQMRIYPVSPTARRFNWPDAINTLTSGCSAMPYRDELFGADYASSLFICEPANNLVHREVLEPDGVTFQSHRAADEQTSEFLASTDNWFRPTMARTGPDGALYVTDMYRLVIEHPEWIPAEMIKRLDLRAGADKGRIYRIAPVGAKLRPIPNLTTLTTTELVAALDSPNGWQRDTAQRLLVERADLAAVGPLERVATSASRPKTRLQALWTLECLGQLTVRTVAQALRDPHPALREAAVRLAEPFIAATSMTSASLQPLERRAGDSAPYQPGQVGRRSPSAPTPEQASDQAVASGPAGRLADALLELVGDPSLRVRYQLAFTLGELTDRRVAAALVALARTATDDEHLRTAVVSSAPRHAAAMLKALLADQRPLPPGLLEPLLTLVFDQPQPLAGALEAIAAPRQGQYAPWQFDAVSGFLEDLERRNLSLTAWSRQAGGAFKTALGLLVDLFAQARRQAEAPAQNLAAVRLFTRLPASDPQGLARLGRWLQPQFPAAVQRAALDGLGRSRGSAAARVLLAAWPSCSPALRLDVANTLMRRPEWVGAWLDAIEQGAVPLIQVSPVHREKLLNNPRTEVRERAQRIFGPKNSDRAEVVRRYDAVNDLVGNPAHGVLLYRQYCSACHRLREEGHEVGPNLGTVSEKSIPQLLEAVLDPNRAVEARYLGYTAVTKNGRELSGVITAETPNSITLKQQGGAEETILRTDLESLAASGLSLMPEGLETALKPQDLADLIAYIKSGDQRAQSTP